MTLSPAALVLLDTNVFVNLVRGNQVGWYLEKEYNLSKRPERPLLSSVVCGEIKGLAKYWEWGSKKLDKLEKILAELVLVSAGESPVIDAYAALYAQLTPAGIKLGENDLWIAATAQAAGATLLTTDSDFDRLPADTVSVERVDPNGIPKPNGV